MKLPRKAFEFVDSSLVTQDPRKVHVEFLLSCVAVGATFSSFIFWNSPGWIYFADIAYLTLILSIFLIAFGLDLAWLGLAFERFYIKKVRIMKFNIEFIASIANLPFFYLVSNTIFDFITNFRPISVELHTLTGVFMTITIFLCGTWCPLALERWHVLKRKFSGEEEEDVVWVEDWVDEWAEEEEEEVEEEWVYEKEEDIEEIEYSEE